MKSFFSTFILCLFLNNHIKCSENQIYSHELIKFQESFSNEKKRKNILLISEVGAYSISLLALNQLWYANYPRSNFILLMIIGSGCRWIK